MRTVRLWGLPDAMLIIPERSGVRFTNQVMGHLCMQPEVEGILVPFTGDYPIDERGRPAVPTIAERLTHVLLNAGEMTDSQADAVDAILAEYAETRGTTVNRGRLMDSGEAWVHVNVVPGDLSLLVGFEPFAAILTWNNSD